MQKIIGDDLDLIVLEEYEKTFHNADGWRDGRLAKRLNRCEKEVYAILSKKRFRGWINFGVSLRSGWLTPEGLKQLAILRSAPPTASPAQDSPR